MAKKIKNILLISLSIFIISFTACDAFLNIGGVDDFDYFINNLTRYSEENKSLMPAVTGFEPLIEFPFEYGREFSGGQYTFVVFDGLDLIVSKDGGFYKITEPLYDKDVLYDKFIFENENLLGVKTIFGDTIVPNLYLGIEIHGDLIVALRYTNDYCIFKGTKRIHTRLDGEITALTNEILIIDNFLYCLELNLLTAGEFRKVTNEINGAIIITNHDNNLFGYYFENEERILTPAFETAAAFNKFGYARVDNKIIDKFGEVAVAQIGTKIPLDFNSTSALYLCTVTNLYAVRNEITNRDLRSGFVNINPQSFFGDYIIENSEDYIFRFYCAGIGDFVLNEFRQITPVQDYFIVQNFNRSFSLLDKNLIPIIQNASQINFDGQVLLFVIDDNYFYYKIND